MKEKEREVPIPRFAHAEQGVELGLAHQHANISCTVEGVVGSWDTQRDRIPNTREQATTTTRATTPETKFGSCCERTYCLA
jgi:hypothetical protein